MDELDRRIAALREPGHRPVVELVDEEMVPIFAAMSGAERLAMAFDMSDLARQLVTSSVRATHPDWDHSRIGGEVARWFADGFTADVSAPYDVIAEKLVYYRESRSERHLSDIAGMLQVAGDRVDSAYIASWAADLGMAAEWQRALDGLAAGGTR